MIADDRSESRVEKWLTLLDERHLSNLTPSEVARALRALSSCYVERRARLAAGGALGTAGKRAAFALFYAPIHFLTTRSIVRALRLLPAGRAHIHDLGCGTGAAGAAWALESAAAQVTGVDRHPWAVAEANATYRELGIDGRAIRLDVARVRIPAAPGTAIIAAYTMNEMPDAARGEILQRLLRAGSEGAVILVVEPIARKVTPWWRTWQTAFEQAGGRADEWRFPAALPRRQRELARAAGLDPKELTARTLHLAGPSRPERPGR